MLTARDVIRIKNASVCAGCGTSKLVGDALCLMCRNCLPSHMLRATLFYQRDSDQEKAVEDAIRCAQQRRQPASVIGAGRHTPRED